MELGHLESRAISVLPPVCVHEKLRAVAPQSAEQLGTALGPSAVDDRPREIQRVRVEQVRGSDATVDRLVVVLADAGDEAVAEIEVHGFLLDRCATYDTTYARRFATL